MHTLCTYTYGIYIYDIFWDKVWPDGRKFQERHADGTTFPIPGMSACISEVAPGGRMEEAGLDYQNRCL